MKATGKLDRENGIVSFQCDDLDLEHLDRFMRWLEQVRWWMQNRKVREDGGRRWELRRGDPPTARFMVGAQCWGGPINLQPVKPRKPCQCSSCRADIEPGAKAWRQKPGSGGGHSRDRFCEHCIERGGPPHPPNLTVIDGGLDLGG